MPRKIGLAHIEEGSVLAEPVINTYGQVLLPAGLTLEQKHVRVLKTWNVAEILVREPEADSAVPVVTDTVRALAEERLSHRLTWKPRNANEQDFVAMGVDHIAEHIVVSAQH